MNELIAPGPGPELPARERYHAQRFLLTNHSFPYSTTCTTSCLHPDCVLESRALTAASLLPCCSPFSKKTSMRQREKQQPSPKGHRRPRCSKRLIVVVKATKVRSPSPGDLLLVLDACLQVMQESGSERWSDGSRFDQPLLQSRAVTGIETHICTRSRRLEGKGMSTSEQRERGMDVQVRLQLTHRWRRGSSEVNEERTELIKTQLEDRLTPRPSPCSQRKDV